MTYKRPIAPHKLARGEDLTQAMTGIGMRFTANPPVKNPNIEDTLIAASIEGMEHDDLRVLSVLVTWIQVHYPRINADRLTRAVSLLTESEQLERVKAFWAAIGEWLKKDRRFARMAKLYSGLRIDVLTVGTDFQIGRKGEDLRFKNTLIRVPANVLRERESDVATPSELARIHSAYRQRILMGPTYRADMWSALENDPLLSVAELARQTYGSFATAWQVKEEFGILAA
jgi:hypothetical protein